MSLRHGLLGLLSKWDATGYDIKKEFDDFMSVFWHSHLSQIYPELNRLEKEQLVESTLVPQEGKPDKKIYSITGKGLDELSKWLHANPDTPKIKDAFLMQVFFMDNIPVEDVIYQLTYYKKERQQRLDKMLVTIKEKQEDIKRRNVMSPRILMAMVVQKRGVEQEVEYIKWCEDTIQLIESCRFLWSDKNNGGATYDQVEKSVLTYFDTID